MAKFKVLRRVDAFVEYAAEVEAETAEQALEKVAGADESMIAWSEGEVVEFDDIELVALDEEGEELAVAELADIEEEGELERA